MKKLYPLIIIAVLIGSCTSEEEAYSAPSAGLSKTFTGKFSLSTGQFVLDLQFRDSLLVAKTPNKDYTMLPVTPASIINQYPSLDTITEERVPRAYEGPQFSIFSVIGPNMKKDTSLHLVNRMGVHSILKRVENNVSTQSSTLVY